MEQILILASLLMLGYLAHRIFSEQPLPFRIVSTLVFFTSTIALSGFIAGSIGAPVNAYAVFIGSSALFAIGLMLLAHEKNAPVEMAAGTNVPAESGYEKRPAGTWVFLLILFAWLILNLFMASGQAIPHGASVDAAAHYALVRYLHDFARLPGADWSFLWEIAHYPFGFHLTTVIVSRLADASPFYVMWILAAMLMGVVVASVSTMLYSDVARGGRQATLVTLWAFIMFAVSPYVTEAYARSGFYPMVLGLVYIVTFIWFLRNVGKIQKVTALFVSTAFSGMALTYPQWLPIVFFIYLYIVIKDPIATKRQQLLYVLIPALCAGAVGLDFLVQHWKGLRYIYNIEGGVERNFSYLWILTPTAFAVMYKLWQGQRRKYLVASLIVMAQVVLVVINKSINGLGGMYPIYKYAYVLTPVLILMLAQGLTLEASEPGYAKYKPILAIAILTVIVLVTDFHSGRVVRAPACITANEYRALEWVKTNVKNSDVYYVGSPLTPLFGYAITGKPQSNGRFEWWLESPLKLSEWLPHASPGDAAMVTGDASEVKKYIDDGKLKALHVEGDSYVIQKP